MTSAPEAPFERSEKQRSRDASLEKFPSVQHELHPSLSGDAIRQRAKPFFPGRALFARGRRLGALAED
jgi:hypothetical protein